MKWENEKGTILKEKTSSTDPKMTNAIEGTTYRLCSAPYRCQPAGKRASPEKTDIRGQASEKVTGMIFRAARNKKKPTNIKKVARKRYRERLLSFIAKTAQPEPKITKKKAAKTDIREVPARFPRRNALPRNMSRNPIIKISRATVLRVDKDMLSLYLEAAAERKYKFQGRTGDFFVSSLLTLNRVMYIIVSAHRFSPNFRFERRSTGVLFWVVVPMVKPNEKKRGNHEQKNQGRYLVRGEVR
jgi:hypothetical protein